MSYKEFVPTAQQGSGGGYTSHDNTISPSIGKFLDRRGPELPYWSPATRRAEDNGDEYNTIDGITDSSNSNSNSQLAPSATEFVPGGGMFRMQSINGLNLQAAAWVPPSVNTNTQSNDQVIYTQLK